VRACVRTCVRVRAHMRLCVRSCARVGAGARLRAGVGGRVHRVATGCAGGWARVPAREEQVLEAGDLHGRDVPAHARARARVCVCVSVCVCAYAVCVRACTRPCRRRGTRTSCALSRCAGTPTGSPARRLCSARACVRVRARARACACVHAAARARVCARVRAGPGVQVGPGRADGAGAGAMRAFGCGHLGNRTVSVRSLCERVCACAAARTVVVAQARLGRAQRLDKKPVMELVEAAEPSDLATNRLMACVCARACVRACACA
jgi:hypothetical protein